jgi:hypothetical protein
MAGSLPINCAPVNPPATAAKFTPNTTLAIRVRRRSAFDLASQAPQWRAAGYVASFVAVKQA